jgi:aspartate ammonia-lyase
VEVSGLLKACAVSMSKIANDLRLLSSGPRCGLGEINLPGMQIGSSIMPYKINPVIAEAVNQVAFTVFGNDVTITKACEAGQLDLNAFLPIIAEKLIETVKLLINSCEMFNHKCIKGITANEEFCLENVYKSLGVATILVPIIGYDKASRIVKYSKENKINVKDAAVKLGIMDEQRVNEIFENLYDLLRPGR